MDYHPPPPPSLSPTPLPSTYTHTTGIWKILYKESILTDNLLYDN